MHVMVGGPAASGKSTLAEALALATGALMADLDDVTADFIAEQLAHERAAGRSDDEPTAMARWRHQRYDLLADHVRRLAAPEVIAVAPFTLELADAAAWQAWVRRAGWDPASVLTVVIELPPDERFRRMAQRGAARDEQHLAAGEPPESGAPVPREAPRTPSGPALVIDGTASLDEQVALVRGRLGHPPP